MTAAPPTAHPTPDAPATEPIAVVGMACRLPGGADSPEALWQLLLDGRDAITDVPPTRWASADWYDPDPAAPGKMRMRQAGFLREDIAAFDAPFFAIAPREAMAMDPQQRLLLEVAWEALERAGCPPDRLAGTACGVFLGLYHDNYGLSLRGSPAPGAIDGWSASGTHPSVAAGRLSYFLDLAGPSLVVDTACSSSLVAVHLAVQSLQSRECDRALAGGVHLLLAPEPLVASSKLGATSPDGRCKAFDAAADGFGHGEGCGLVVLRRLSDALADGDPIHAVIRGTCVNQDGRSNSLTAPSGPAQERAVRTALARAGIAPRQVGYVEAHGTGTPLGDPIEIEALASALAEGRDTPLAVGAVKTNLGHLEAAAGIAGLLKAILCVERGEIPATLHFATLNPHIDVGDFPLVIPTQRQAWAGIDGRRIAGVSAFGFSGTNAHVVIEAASPSSRTRPDTARPEILALSARSPAAATTLAERWAERLSRGETTLADAAHTAARRRHFRHRVAVVGSDPAAVAQALRRAKPEEAPRTPRIAFVFTGQGAQFAGMAKQAYDAWPVFRETLDAHLDTLTPLLGENARERLFGAASLDDTRLAQPLTVAVALALVRLWREWGIEPAAVAGHSVGEFAAAVVAGVLTPRDALTLVAARGRLMQALPAGGGMLAVAASSSQVEPLLVEGLGIAAINGPASVVVSGPLDALARCETRLRDQGLRCAPLSVSHAFHSALLEPALPAFEREAAARSWHAPTLPIVSNVTGQSHTTFDAAYWRRHAREPVRFHAGLEALAALGCDTFLEIGPHAVLTPLGAAGLPGRRFVASLRKGVADSVALAEAQAALYRAGAPLRWEAITHGRVVDGPTYPFERERFWFDPGVARPASAPTAASIPASQPTHTTVGSPVVYDFYDELTVIAGSAEQPGMDGAEPREDDEGNLSFGFLPEPVPGFSWVQGLFERGPESPSRALFLRSQQALKDALFEGIDFSPVRRVMDYGCGHAADLCRLAVRHPHLDLTGYTLSARQVQVGEARARRLGVAERVHLHRRDSSADPFPGPFDIIFGIEVTGLIPDKDALFDNVVANLAPGGLLAIADFVAGGEAIANPDTSSFTPSVEQWAELLACRRLRLVRATDGSRAVANWLVDEHFEQHVAERVQRFGLSALTHRHLLSNGNIGKALRQGLMRYLLLLAQPSPHESEASLREANGATLRAAPAVRGESLGAGAWRGWVSALAWPRAAPLARPVEPAQIAAALQPALERERVVLAPLASAHHTFDALARAFVSEALRAADTTPGWQPAEGQRRLLAHLRKQDSATKPTERVRTSAASQLADARRAHPEAEAELALLARCGPQLAEALAGRADPLELLFPGGDTALAEALYERSPWSRAVQRLAGEAVARLPREVPLRVIEIGGGTGATTSHVLGALPAGSRYLFTDLGASLVERARQRFADRGLDVATLDISRSPATQGIAPGAWDVVVAANVLHATPSLADTLAHVRELLAPGGLLLLIENTSPLPWGDLTFGLTPGMWQFRDEAVRQHALVSASTWSSLLGAAGFDAVDILSPDVEGEGGVSRQRLLLARRSPKRRWLLAGGDRDLADALAQALRGMGDNCAQAPEAASGIPEGITDVAILALSESGSTDPAPALRTALRTLQSASASREPVSVTVVTRGALGVSASGEATGPASLGVAAVPGLCRAVAAECPDLRLRFVDADPATAAAGQAMAIAKELAHGSAAEVALRGTERREPQLHALTPDSRPPARFDGTASYLVTGAFGGIGLALLPWLAERGARQLALMGRRAPDAAAEAVLQGLRDRGVAVHVLQGDVSRRADVDAAVAAARASAPLRGVFHAAGVVADASVAQLDEARFTQVLAAKAVGTTHLHEATRADALDHFVLFSSAAGLLGPAGQANHAAACAFQSAFAHARRAQGLPAVAIDWGAWADVGAAAPEAIERHVSRTGLRPMPPSEALHALDWALAAAPAEIAVVDADWPTYRTRYRRGAEPAMIRALGTAKTVERSAASAEPTRPAARQWHAELQALAPGRREDGLRDLIRHEAARILGLHDAASLDDHAPLREAGLDSLMAVEMRNALATAAGQRLPATLLFDHPAIADLADALARGAFADCFPASAPSTPSGLEGLDAEALAAVLAHELQGTEPTR